MDDQAEKGDAVMRNNLDSDETQYIQKTFTEELLKVMRALFLGLNVTEADKNHIRAIFSDKNAIQIVHKRFLPTINRDMPIGQVSDQWLGAEKMVFGSSPGTIKQAIEYKQRAIEMTDMALKLLENPDGQAVSIAYTPGVTGGGKEDEWGIELLGRNQFIRHIESQLLFLWLIVGQAPKDPKDKKEALAADSSQ